MKIKIEVTQEHIDRGFKGSCSFCPVALAIKEGCLFKEVLVGDFHVEFSKDKEAVLPKHVQKFIKDFDAGREVKPATFTLTIKKL